jgi:DNA polymerase III subunit beta
MTEFTMSRDELRRGLAWAAHGVPGRDAHSPVLTMTRVAVATEGVTFGGFNYETSATACLPATVATPGTTFIPGRLAAVLSESLPDAPVDFSTDGA